MNMVRRYAAADMAMHLEILDGPEDRTCVKLSGALDLAGVQQVELRLTALVVGRRRNAVVDMSAVDGIASLGIGMLLSIGRAVAGNGCRLLLVAPQANVLEVLRRMRVDGVLSIVPDHASAEAELPRR